MGATVESTFGSKLSGRSYRKRHCHKTWFNIDCLAMKHELKLWLKTNPDSHAAKHKESKLKNLLKKKIFFWEIVRAQHICVLAKVDALLFWKKYRPRPPIVDKISVTAFLEGFHRLVGQSPPPVRLRADHLGDKTST
jgi:hypothetical protein